MALDLQQEIQRLAGMVQSGEITRETFQAQVQQLRAQATTAAKQAVAQKVRSARPAQVIHRSGQIVESGPDVRAGFRNFSLVLALLALAVIGLVSFGALRGGAGPSFSLPSIPTPRIRIPDASQERRERAPEPVGPEPRAFPSDEGGSAKPPANDK